MGNGEESGGGGGGRNPPIFGVEVYRPGLKTLVSFQTQKPNFYALFKLLYNMYTGQNYES